MDHRTVLGIAVLAGFGSLLFLLERAVALRKATRALLGRRVVNLASSALALAAAPLLVQPAVKASLGRLAEEPFGVVRLVALPGPDQKTGRSARIPPQPFSWKARPQPPV